MSAEGHGARRLSEAELDGLLALARESRRPPGPGAGLADRIASASAAAAQTAAPPSRRAGPRPPRSGVARLRRRVWVGGVAAALLTSAAAAAALTGKLDVAHLAELPTRIVQAIVHPRARRPVHAAPLARAPSPILAPAPAPTLLAARPAPAPRALAARALAAPPSLPSVAVPAPEVRPTPWPWGVARPLAPAAALAVPSMGLGHSPARLAGSAPKLRRQERVLAERRARETFERSSRPERPFRVERAPEDAAAADRRAATEGPGARAPALLADRRPAALRAEADRSPFGPPRDAPDGIRRLTGEPGPRGAEPFHAAALPRSTDGQGAPTSARERAGGQAAAGEGEGSRPAAWAQRREAWRQRMQTWRAAHAGDPARSLTAPRSEAKPAPAAGPRPGAWRRALGHPRRR